MLAEGRDGVCGETSEQRGRVGCVKCNGWKGFLCEEVHESDVSEGKSGLCQGQICVLNNSLACTGGEMW